MLVLLLPVVEFVVDLITPLGITDWVWYVVPLLLSVYVGGRFLPFWLAALFSLLTLTGFYLSPPGMDPHPTFISRMVGIAMFWVMAFIITKRKQAETAMMVSELRYRRLFEAAQDGILILNADNGRIVDVNPFLTKLLDYSRENFIGKHLWELGFFKDIAASEAHFKELQAKDYIRYDDLPMETSAGRRIEVEFVSNVYQANGHKVIQCNIRDITERKQAEETFNKFFEQPMALNLIAKLDGVIHRVNQGMTDLLGYDRARLMGVNFLDLVHPDDRAATIAEMGKLAQGVNILYFENRYRQKNGAFRLLAWSASVSPADQMIFAVASDITERKQAEASLARLAMAVEQTSETIMITDTAGNIIYANPAFEKSTGYTCAEAIGQNPRILKGGKQDAAFYRQMWALLQRGEVWHGHFSNKRKDGKYSRRKPPSRPCGGCYAISYKTQVVNH